MNNIFLKTLSTSFIMLFIASVASAKCLPLEIEKYSGNTPFQREEGPQILVGMDKPKNNYEDSVCFTANVKALKYAEISLQGNIADTDLIVTIEEDGKIAFSKVLPIVMFEEQLFPFLSSIEESNNKMTEYKITVQLAYPEDVDFMTLLGAAIIISPEEKVIGVFAYQTESPK